VLPALEPQLGVVQERLAADRELPVLDLEHDPARALRRLEREAERLAVARVALEPVDLPQLLEPRLRLARPRARPEARDEPLQRGDLRLLLLDRAAERELARRLLLAPRVPRALEELAAPALELEHRGADRLQEPAVVCDEHDGRVQRLEVALEPLERGDVEVVGGLVEEQEVGVAGQRPRQRCARQLPARERGQHPVEVLVAKAEPVQRRVDAFAPGVAAGVLEPRLGVGIRAHDGEVALGHAALELRQPLLKREQVTAAAQHVVAQRQVAVARRALVVQLHARVLRERELPAVDARLPREHAQERGLPGAVAAREGQPVTPLELERDATEQRVAHHVLGEV
jgi:hypothetical protein